MKTLLTTVFLFLVYLANGQSKKEQIAILNTKIDSLNSLIANKINAKDNGINFLAGLNKQDSALSYQFNLKKDSVKQIKLNIIKVNDNLNTTVNDLKATKFKYSKSKTELTNKSIKSDSITSILMQYDADINSNLVVQFEVNRPVKNECSSDEDIIDTDITYTVFFNKLIKEIYNTGCDEATINYMNLDSKGTTLSSIFKSTLLPVVQTKIKGITSLDDLELDYDKQKNVVVFICIIDINSEPMFFNIKPEELIKYLK